MAKQNRCKVCCGQCNLINNYICASSLRQPTLTCIGIITVFICVFFVGTLWNALKFIPITLWNVAESQGSQNDIMILPSVGDDTISSASFKNLNESLMKYPEILGLSSRILLPAKCSKRLDSTVKETCYLMVQDTEREFELGVGRNWLHRKLEPNEAHLTDGILARLKLGSGDNIYADFGLDGDDISSTIRNMIGNISLPFIDTDTIVEIMRYVFENGKMRFEIVDEVDDRYGKFQSMGNVLVAEMDGFAETLADMVYQTLIRHPNTTIQGQAGTFRDVIAQLDVTDTWTQSVAQFKKRLDVYVDDPNRLSMIIKERANEIYKELGYDSELSILMTTFQTMQVTDLLRSFLDQIFLSTVLVMMLLGVILIYTILLSDVEDKTYEYGMLRAIGMSNKTLVGLMTTASQYLAVPGTVIGVALSAIAVAIACGTVGPILYYKIPYYFKWDAALLAVLIGILIPLITNFYPIYHAVTSTLRDSLDLYHQLNSNTRVTIINLEKLGMSPTVIVTALVAVVLGISIFYGAPTAFFSGKLSNFLLVLILVMIVMLVGLILIAIFLQPFLERLWVYVIVCCKEVRFRGLVKKSLTSHRSRNTKTAIMFTGSLSFIIFAGAEFALMTGLIKDMLKSSFGADLVFTAPNIRNHHNLTSVNSAIKAAKELEDSPIIEATYKTYTLASQTSIQSTTVSSLMRYGSSSVSIFGVPDSYLAGTYSEFYYPLRVRSGLKYNETRQGRSDLFQSINNEQRSTVLPIEKEIPVDKIISVLSGPTKAESIAKGMGWKRDHGDTTERDAFPKMKNRTIQQMYADSIDVVISEGIFESLGLKSIDDPIILSIRLRHAENQQVTTIHRIAKVRGTLKTSPGMTMGSFAMTASGSHVIVPMTQYIELMKECIVTTEQIKEADAADYKLPVQDVYFMLRETPKPTKEQMNRIVDCVMDVTHQDTSVQNTPVLLDTIQVTLDVLNAFFIVFSILAIIMCFFVLWISFISNVRDNAWEFGVLRSIGLTGWQTIRVYVYEALSIVLSCIIFGTIIGIAISIVLTWEITLFTELPFTFSFPTTFFCIAVGLSILVAILGSIFAALDMKKKDIATVIRSGQ
ncbi:putative permease family protein [Blattamonas nauphoetae]|uniref:Permease family protein n=1 Tax=Blattamonas nauphoetae TaxID=2049346 RepID=A0ABQ9XMA8_9EUKA|nr:putative permease family protein [Blattamonas nauphoetae]